MVNGIQLVKGSVQAQVALESEVYRQGDETETVHTHRLRIILSITMPAKQEGRIFRHGTSGVVAIPPGYLRYHELNPGDEVTVLYDSLVLVIPKKLMGIAAQKRELIDKLLRG